mgnify:CR=1 FL=1
MIFFEKISISLGGAFSYTDIKIKSKTTKEVVFMESGTLAQHLLTWRQRTAPSSWNSLSRSVDRWFYFSSVRKMGISVTRNVGGTGLVGTLTCGNGEGTIGLRADMDANS